jgi:superfamily I DNA/RNA helicase
MHREQPSASVGDQAGALRALARGASSVQEVGQRLEHIFSNIGQGKALACSTVHKAKGLEWARVFTLERPFPRAVLPRAEHSQGISREIAVRGEESNVRYVALTRAKNELVLVGP